MAPLSKLIARALFLSLMLPSFFCHLVSLRFSHANLIPSFPASFPLPFTSAAQQPRRLLQLGGERPEGGAHREAVCFGHRGEEFCRH